MTVMTILTLVIYALDVLLAAAMTKEISDMHQIIRWERGKRRENGILK